jgi:hypothetical protein
MIIDSAPAIDAAAASPMVKGLFKTPSLG